MRRVIFAIVWFVIFAVGGLGIGGAIVGGAAGADAAAGSKTPPTTFSDGYRVGYNAGHSAGQELGRKYGGLILLVSLVLAVGGSALGILPGTRRRRVATTPDA